MTPARILFVELNEDGTTGGSHQALLDLVTHLDRRRFTPVVLCYQDNRFVERFRAAGAEVHVWDAERRRERAVRGPWWFPHRVLTQATAIARRVRFIRHERIALVHINNSPSYSYADWLPAARIAGVRCVSHLRGELVPRPPFPARWLIPRFDRLLAISGYIEDRLRVAGVPPDRVTRVTDGIDATALRARLHKAPALVRRELGIPDDAFLVLMVGHLRAWKGQDVLLRAVASLDAAVRTRMYVVLAGQPDPYDPAYAQMLHALADGDRLRDRVSIFAQRPDIPDMMRAADVVVHASTLPEPFGLVVVEAMALGRPLVASALGGPGEIVSAGSGWTFDPKSPDELAALLRALVEDPSRGAAVGPAAVARAEVFSITRTVAAVERIYDELLGAAAAPSAGTLATAAASVAGSGA
jgi:glycosyltransferase involved in cell wall biosynthesis